MLSKKHLCFIKCVKSRSITSWNCKKWALNYTTILHNLDTYKKKQASWSGNVKNEIESDVWVLTEWVCSKCLRELLRHSGSNSFRKQKFLYLHIMKDYQDNLKSWYQHSINIDLTINDINRISSRNFSLPIISSGIWLILLHFKYFKVHLSFWK